MKVQRSIQYNSRWTSLEVDSKNSMRVKAYVLFLWKFGTTSSEESTTEPPSLYLVKAVDVKVHSVLEMEGSSEHHMPYSAAPPQPAYPSLENTNAMQNSNITSDENMGDLESEEMVLLNRIKIDTIRLYQIREQKLMIDNQNQPTNQATRKKFTRGEDRILRTMLKLMVECKAQGFVYGIIPENGKAVSGTSENLRDWWQKKVHFERNGPSAIDKYFSENVDLDFIGEKPDINIREKLWEISDSILGSLLSALMQRCSPPQRHFPLENGVPPPWWPKPDVEWWEELGFPTDIGQPPYKKPHDLRKTFKVAVLVAVIKNMCPETNKMRALVYMSKGLQEKMSFKDSTAWSAVLDQVDREFKRLHPDVVLPGFASYIGCSTVDSSSNIESDHGVDYSGYSNGNSYSMPTNLTDMNLSATMPISEVASQQVNTYSNPYYSNNYRVNEEAVHNVQQQVNNTVAIQYYNPGFGAGSSNNNIVNADAGQYYLPSYAAMDGITGVNGQAGPSTYDCNSQFSAANESLDGLDEWF